MLFKCQNSSISSNSLLQKYAVWFYLAIDRTLSGVTTPCQNGSGTMTVKEYSAFPKSPGFIGTSPSDCLVSYPGYPLWVSWI